MAIRSMTPQDIPAVFELYNQTKLDELALEPQSFTLIPLAEDHARRTALLESDVYVFEEEQILGVAAIHDCEIRALFVSPFARKRGVAKHLLNHILASASGPIVLTVVQSNTPARKLYEQLGFRQVKQAVAKYNGQSVAVSELVLGL